MNAHQRRIKRRRQARDAIRFLKFMEGFSRTLDDMGGPLADAFDQMARAFGRIQLPPIEHKYASVP